jgi:glycosyltransferase involved in cell wall biosynthesis
MLYLVPLEPLDERYTKQWSIWIPKALTELKIPFKEVSGTKYTDKINVGDVLDVYGTHYYKYSQLQKIVDLIQRGEITHGDELWFADLWFPGIEGLFYIRAMTGIQFRITGVLHAGTWDKHDFTFKNGMHSWAHNIERGWLDQIDTVFLGSEFHRDLILDTFGNDIRAKLKVTGLFFDAGEVNRNKKEKENIIVFPHRLDSEKHPEMFDLMADEYGDGPWKFVKTMDVTKNKEEYYKLLGKAKIAISFSAQETFGYAMLEAMANGCDVLVPNRLSYKTMPIYANRKYNSYTEDLPSMLQNSMCKLEVNSIGMLWGNRLDYFSPVEVCKRMFL